MAYINNTHSAHISLTDRVTATLKSMRAAMHRRKVYKQTVNELSALSNRELTDLGLSRSMISRVALESTYGK